MVQASPLASGGTLASGETAFGTLSELAYSRIRSGILQGSHRGDTPLREVELARALGISRTPVREALRRLQAEGLLEPVPHVGYRVLEWDPAELSQVYDVRIALERLAARTAALERTRVQLAVIAEALDELRAATARDDDALPQRNQRFHALIAEASGNAYLRATLANIADIFHRYPAAERTLAHRLEALSEHEKLADAIERRDPEAAERIMSDHLAGGRASLLAPHNGEAADDAAER